MLEGDFQFRKHARVKLKTPTKDGQTEVDSYQLLRTSSSAQREIQLHILRTLRRLREARRSHRQDKGVTGVLALSALSKTDVSDWYTSGGGLSPHKNRSGEWI